MTGKQLCLTFLRFALVTPMRFFKMAPAMLPPTAPLISSCNAVLRSPKARRFRLPSPDGHTG